MKPLSLIFAALAIAAIISGAFGNHTHYVIAIPLAITGLVMLYSHKYEQSLNTSRSTPKKVFIIGDHVMITDCYSVRCRGIVKAVSRDTVSVEFTDSQGEYHNTLYMYDQIFPLKDSISKL